MWHLMLLVLGVKVLLELPTSVQVAVGTLYVAYWAINKWLPDLVLRRKLRHRSVST